MRTVALIAIISLFSLPAWADETMEITGQVWDELKILEINATKVIEKHLDTGNIYDSYMVVELSGKFEENTKLPEGGGIHAALHPAQVGFNGEERQYLLKLFPSVTTNDLLVIDGGARVALSKPTNFKVTVRINTYNLEWYTCNGLCRSLTWTVTSQRKSDGMDRSDRSIDGIVKMGFAATLRNTDAAKEWHFSEINVKPAM